MELIANWKPKGVGVTDWQDMICRYLHGNMVVWVEGRIFILTVQLSEEENYNNNNNNNNNNNKRENLQEPLCVELKDFRLGLAGTINATRDRFICQPDSLDDPPVMFDFTDTNHYEYCNLNQNNNNNNNNNNNYNINNNNDDNTSKKRDNHGDDSTTTQNISEKRPKMNE